MHDQDGAIDDDGSDAWFAERAVRTGADVEGCHMDANSINNSG